MWNFNNIGNFGDFSQFNQDYLRNLNLPKEPVMPKIPEPVMPAVIMPTIEPVIKVEPRIAEIKTKECKLDTEKLIDKIVDDAVTGGAIGFGITKGNPQGTLIAGIAGGIEGVVFGTLEMIDEKMKCERGVIEEEKEAKPLVDKECKLNTLTMFNNIKDDIAQDIISGVATKDVLESGISIGMTIADEIKNAKSEQEECKSMLKFK